MVKKLSYDPEKVPIMASGDFAKIVLTARGKMERALFDSMVEYLQTIVDQLADYHRLEKFLVAQRHACLEAIIDALSNWGATGDISRGDSKLVKKGKLLYASCIARLGYERLKGAALAARYRTPAGLRGLSRGYKFEQLNRPGAAAVHTDALPQTPADLAANGPLTPADNANLRITGNDDMDFYAIKKFIKSYVATGGMANLKYMDDEQRNRIRLEFNRRGVYRGGGVFNTPDPAAGWGAANIAAYACSPAGEFYSTWEGELGGAQRLNHSSFMSGRPVICAGVIVVEFGHLRKIDNNSGHYKPSITDLQAACQAILAKGYDPPANCVARVMDFGGANFPGFNGTPHFEPSINGPIFEVPLRDYAARGAAAVLSRFGARPSRGGAARGDFLGGAYRGGAV